MANQNSSIFYSFLLIKYTYILLYWFPLKSSNIWKRFLQPLDNIVFIEKLGLAVKQSIFIFILEFILLANPVKCSQQKFMNQAKQKLNFFKKRSYSSTKSRILLWLILLRALLMLKFHGLMNRMKIGMWSF